MLRMAGMIAPVAREGKRARGASGGLALRDISAVAAPVYLVKYGRPKMKALYEAESPEPVRRRRLYAPAGYLVPVLSRTWQPEGSWQKLAPRSSDWVNGLPMDSAARSLNTCAARADRVSQPRPESRWP